MLGRILLIPTLPTSEFSVVLVSRVLRSALSAGTILHRRYTGGLMLICTELGVVLILQNRLIKETYDDEDTEF